MITFMQGDMFEIPADIRVNTVNCVGVMGAGVALAFKQRYPEMFRAYVEACRQGRVRPGELDIWRTLTEWIINFPTKRHWRQKSRYEDIEAGLVRLREYLADKPRIRVALPALGCGHGGLDWARVSMMISQHLADLDAEIFVFTPADSRRVGEQVAKDQRLQTYSPELTTVRRGAPEFPERLERAGVEQMSVVGNAALLLQPHVAVFNSSEPEEMEESAAVLCLEALASKRVTIALRFGTRLSHDLALLATQFGANVILWAAAGLEWVKIPSALESKIQAGEIATVSPWPTSSRWTRQIASHTSALQATASRAVFITDPNPQWIPKALGTADHAPPMFFIRYERNLEVGRRLERRGARPINKDRRTRKPNVAPILAVLA